MPASKCGARCRSGGVRSETEQGSHKENIGASSHIKQPAKPGACDCLLKKRRLPHQGFFRTQIASGPLGPDRAGARRERSFQNVSFLQGERLQKGSNVHDGLAGASTPRRRRRRPQPGVFWCKAPDPGCRFLLSDARPKSSRSHREPLS